MIVDKFKSEQKQFETQEVIKPISQEDNQNTIEKENNPLEEIYAAVRRVLESVCDPDNPKEKLFRTVKIDNGQFERIVRNKQNDEYAVVFPAVFVRFVNVRFLTSQQRIGEGRATLRIRYILNDLNNSDDVVETRGFRVFQSINDAIQDAKSYEAAINERCNLQYWDMLESLNNGLQPYWIDYEIWFRTSSSFQYRNWVERYIVIPPFTNHSDAPEHDSENHGQHTTPNHDDVTGFS